MGYLRQPGDEQRVAGVIQKLAGVEQVLTRIKAAKAFDLMPERIGDLVVTGDRDTVFGNVDHESERLMRIIARMARVMRPEFRCSFTILLVNQTRAITAGISISRLGS